MQLQYTDWHMSIKLRVRTNHINNPNPPKVTHALGEEEAVKSACVC